MKPTHTLRLALLPLLALCAAATAGAVPATPDPGPRETIRAATDDVVAALRAELPYADRLAGVEAALTAHVDFNTVSKLVLARNWKKLDEAQQRAFEIAFRRHLVLTYWKNAAEASFDEIEITKDRDEGRGDWTVKTEVGLTGAPLLMDYRLRKFGEGDGADWRIIDIIIEGVSMVSNFRSQFQEVFGNSGAQGLIDAVIEKNQLMSEKQRLAADEEDG